MERTTLTLLVLAGLLSLSGCAGSAGPASTSKAQPSLVKANAFDNVDSDSAGEIAGRVVDDEFRPLSDVSVRVLSTPVEVKTTQDGVFYIANVPPRSYTVQFDRPGFEARNQSVTVLPSQRVLLEVLLRQVVDLGSYRDEGFIFRGQINCSVRVNASGTNTNPECGAINPDMDQARQRYMDLLPGVTSLLIEVAWTPTVPVANDKLTLAIRPVEGLSWRQVSGPSPIKFMVHPADWVEIQKISDKDYVTYGGQVQFFMFPGEAAQTGTVNLGTTIQQDFTIYATAWYRMDAEEGFSRLPA